jgi:hypothetical protein
MVSAGDACTVQNRKFSDGRVFGTFFLELCHECIDPVDCLILPVASVNLTSASKYVHDAYSRTHDFPTQ